MRLNGYINKRYNVHPLTAVVVSLKNDWGREMRESGGDRYASFYQLRDGLIYLYTKLTTVFHEYGIKYTSLLRAFFLVRACMKKMVQS